MKALILAAGYATRLYPLTKDRPKPLLPVAGKPICDYIVEKIHQIGEVGQIFVVTNGKFFPHFSAWQKAHPLREQILVVNDNTYSEKERLGAIGDIAFVLQKHPIEEDLLILAGDNLFEFSLGDFAQLGREKRAPVVGARDFSHDRRALSRYGVVQLDDEGKVIHFEEKPKEPKSDYAAIGVYFFPKEVLPLFQKYLEEGNNPDAPGFFIQWLYQRTPVYAFVFQKEWYDIGSREMLEKADEVYRRRLSSPS